jgi:hypothetical protein
MNYTIGVTEMEPEHTCTNRGQFGSTGHTAVSPFRGSRMMEEQKEDAAVLGLLHNEHW